MTKQQGFESVRRFEKVGTTVTKGAIGKTSFINNLRFIRRPMRFPTAVARYADKAFVTRVFFVFGQSRVTPARVLESARHRACIFETSKAPHVLSVRMSMNRCRRAAAHRQNVPVHRATAKRKSPAFAGLLQIIFLTVSFYGTSAPWNLLGELGNLMRQARYLTARVVLVNDVALRRPASDPARPSSSLRERRSGRPS